MDVNKFGHHINKMQKLNHFTVESSFDAQCKTIKHIGTPIEPDDCATKEYVDKISSELLKKLKSVDDFVSQLNSEVQSAKSILERVNQKIKK